MSKFISFAVSDRQGNAVFSRGYNFVSGSFIKIDVEGSEMKVLKGSMEMIRRERPRLAVCVYHRNQDIVEIPLLLHNIMPDYKFF